ncbi:MAG TPA: hypothetical protein VJ810_05775 [Blastocatellia bacterium]|nr:hypothetical protein [Blastocatellia bacterium]
MDIELLKRHFAGIGARVKVGDARVTRWSNDAGIDIRADSRGEFFDIKIDAKDPREYRVIDLRPEQRHLLLLSERDKAKFLCGFDERHWFVCAVPGEGVTNVRAAMEALQPAEVRLAVDRRVKRAKNRLRRHNEAFVRQGEWFFIPAPELVVEEAVVRRNEPISRGRGSKPHMCQFAYRTAGELVMVCNQHPSGVPMNTYEKLLQDNPKARNWGWRQMSRNAEVYVRGRVWHPDHKTLILRGWHRVLMNTEHMAPGRSAVTFLD